MNLISNTLVLTESELLEAVQMYYARAHGRAEINKVMLWQCSWCSPEKGHPIDITHGICPEHQQAYLTEDAKALVKAIDPKCLMCGQSIREDDMSPDVHLCKSCHDEDEENTVEERIIHEEN